MAVIFNGYYWDHDVFNRTDYLTSSGALTTPIPMVSSPYSGYGFIGEGSGIIGTLTFRTAGTIDVELGCYDVLYKSPQIHGDSGMYSISSGKANNKVMYIELYTAGTNNCVYRKSVTAPGPGNSNDGEDYVDTTLNVTAAGTYDLKIRCQTSYTFYDMWSAYDEDQLGGDNVSEIHVEWYLYVDAEDSYTPTQSKYIEGYLYDEERMELSGVGIYLKGNTSIGTTTDTSGYYILGPLTPEQYNTGTIVVNWLPGYKTLEFPLNGRDELDIYLELEEVEPEPEPEPERPNLPANKIVTVQNIVDFLTGNDKTTFANNASNRGYSSTKCPPIWIIDAIINSTNVSLSVPSFTTSTKNKLVKYSDLAEGLYTMRFVDLDQMIDFYNQSTEYNYYIANGYTWSRYDSNSYPTTNLYYGESNTIVGTKDQWENLYNTIYDPENESQHVILLNTEETDQFQLSDSFYDALYELAFGTAKQQDVYISPEYTLTIEDWYQFITQYEEQDVIWELAPSITGPFLEGNEYPTSHLYCFDGSVSNTITGYIWQWNNFINYWDSIYDVEWPEYLGLVIPDEVFINDYEPYTLGDAIKDIVYEEGNQSVYIYQNSSTPTQEYINVDPLHYGGWLLDNTNNPNLNLYDMYKSNTNKGVHNSIDMMKITFSGYSEFTIYIRSYAESNWDYVVASTLNYALPTTSSSYPGGTSSPTMSGAMTMTKGNAQSGTSLSSYTPVTYSNLDPNTQYFITVVYRKDSSTSTNDDRGYVLVPKALKTTASFDVTPTYKTVSASAQSFDVLVSNSYGNSYLVSSNVSWITVSSSSPRITVSQNTSTSSRTGVVTFQGGGVTKTVTVVQQGTNSTSQFTLPIYYVSKGWLEEEQFEVDARVSAAFTGSYAASLFSNVAITDGHGQMGDGDRRVLIQSYSIPQSYKSGTYLKIWGHDNTEQEGRVYVVKVSSDGDREIITSIIYMDEFYSTSASPRFNIPLSTFAQDDQCEIWFEQGDNVTGIQGL